MTVIAPSPPLSDPLVDQRRLATWPWQQFFGAQSQQQAQTSVVVGRVDASSQGAAIASTSIPIQTVRSGLYQVSYYVAVTQAAGTSSSLSVSLGWTQDSVSQTYTGSTLTGNTTTTLENLIQPFVVDSGSTITYSTTYASSGTPSMEYRLYIVAEFLG